MSRAATGRPSLRAAASAAARRPSRSASPAAEIALGARVGWWALVALWLFVAAALFSYSPADPPGHAVSPPNHPAANWCGFVGAHLAHYTFTLFGWGAWVLLFGAGVGVFVTPWRRPFDHVALRAVGLIVLALAVSGFQALLFPGSGMRPEGGGGLVAIVGVAELTARFGGLGSALWLLLGALVGATLAFDKWVLAAPGLFFRWALPGVAAGFARAQAAWTDRRERRRKARKEARKPRVRANDVDDDRPAGADDQKLERKAARKAALATPVEEEDEDDAEETPAPAPAPARKRAALAEPEPEDDEEAEAVDEAEEAEDDDEADDAPGAPQVFDAEALRAKIAKLPVRFAATGNRVATDEDMADLQAQASLEGYRFPGLDLLEEPEHNFSEKIEAHVRAQATSLEEALRVYRIDGEVVGIDSGPVITLYEVKLAPGTKVAALQAVSSDLARALKAVNIRIVPNTAGRDTVGVEVPNLEKEKVRLKELLRYHEPGDASQSGPEAEGPRKKLKQKLPMFLGKDAHGEPLIEDLASMPHMLIAGTTGSGKSVCINTIIMSFLYTKRPDELKLVLIDPKMVEMSQFRDIPHLMCPVVTEMGKACAILEWAVTKMDERYELLAEAGVRDIATYNDMPWEDLRERFNPQSEQEEARIPRKLPYIVFIIDELADLMMTQKEVETAIVRIAQKARAVGIHLVLATQRPQANVVTGLIKSNMPGRISFKVASGMDSRIVLDQKGGELLLGQGDMLFLSPRSHKLMRSQGTLVEDKEIRRVVRFLKDVAAPTFERKLLQLRAGGGEDVDGAEERGLENAQKDPLFDKAVEIVLETKRGSVSLLQRRLAIGYSRASRLIDLMGSAGIISDHKGTVARDVVITPEEWIAMKAQAEADAIAAEEAQRAHPQKQRDLFEPEAEAKPAPGAENPPFDVEDDDAADIEEEDEVLDDAQAVGDADPEEYGDEEEDEEDDDEEEWDEDEDDDEEWEEDDDEDEDEDGEDDDEEEEPDAEDVETRPVTKKKPTP